MPRITALPPATRAAADMELPAVDLGAATTKKVTVGMLMPTGAIMDFAGSTAPDGFLMCYGQALNADTSPEYQPLYDVIGNSYGGSDNSNFVVPDLRGRVAAGKDDMGGSAAGRLTDIAGSVDGEALGDAGGLESTRHAFLRTALNTSKFQDMGANYLSSVESDISTYLEAGSSSAVSASVTVRNLGGTIRTQGTTGTEVGHYRYTAPNIQPTIILNKIIKY